MRASVAAVLLVVLGAAGCARRRPAPDVGPVPAEDPGAAPSAGAGARGTGARGAGATAPGASGGARGGAGGAVVAFTWASAARRLEVVTEAEIVPDGAAGDAAGGAPPAAPPTPERVRTVVRLADSLQAGAAPGSVRAVGVVEAYEVSATGRVQGSGAPPFAPLPYVALSDARGVRADPAPGAGVDLRCSAPTGAAALGALAAVRETLPRVPARVASGARWRDTTVSAACAGPALVVVQTASTYEARSGGRPGALVVVRRSVATLRGQGAAGVRPVAVTGRSAGEARYELDAASGALAGAEATTRTVLTVTVAGAAQRFVQRASTRVSAAPR